MDTKELEVSTISNYLGLESIKTEWDALLSKTTCEPACLHWEWHSLWWKYFALKDYESHILVFRSNNQLVGIFPLVLIPVKTLFGTDKVLFFSATGEQEHEEITSEYIDLIVLPGLEKTISEAAADFLLNDFTQWDSLQLLRYLENSVLKKYFLPAIKARNFRKHTTTCGYRHYISLEGDYKSYVKARSRTFRKTLRNNTSRLQKMGSIEFAKINTAAELESVLKILKKQHIVRFANLGLQSAFHSERFTGFHRELMKSLLKKNELVMLVKTLDGEVICIEYAFVLNNTLYAYLGTFEINIERVSTGFLSINKMIKHAFENKIKKFDFMMGDLDSYATSYGCEQQPLYSAEIYNSSVYNLIKYYQVEVKNIVKENFLTRE